MPGHLRIIVDVWREACRHIEISRSAEAIAQRLAASMPVGHLLVRRVDLEHLCVDTVAVGAGSAAGAATIPARTPCSAAQLNSLTAWESRGAIITRDDPAWGEVRELLLSREVHGDCLIGPLMTGEGYGGGALIILAEAHARFDGGHVKLFEALLEPFSVALENDRRLHELASLREAAEAEARALLARMGRKQLQEVVVGSEAGLKSVLERVEVVCASDVPVLLLGETGTGKEVVARAIHSRSPRRDKPFIRVNCGAIPGELIDSQLFGHERGSFTGAVDTHRGWFERADTGTLLLDEIGELPPAAQVRLLRVLQDGYVERVGGRQSIHLDVRIVAATHRDLAAMVRQGTFREDLWYRLAVFPIPIPPLRARPEDVAPLACHFAEKAATRFGLPLVMPTPEDLRLLREYTWPGNVRELGTVIDRAALLGNGARLEVAKALGAVPSIKELTPAAVSAPWTWPAAVHTASPTPSAEVGSPPDGRGSTALNEVMRRHIEQVLTETCGRVEGPFGAARRLGINPHTLRYRMRKLGIAWKRFRPPAPRP